MALKPADSIVTRTVSTRQRSDRWGARYGFDYLQPWSDLPAEAKKIALDGTGEEVFEVNWQFKRDNRTGEHQFHGPWKGFINLVNEEYSRKHADHRGESMMNLMKTASCKACRGSRLRPEALEFCILGKNIAELSALPVSASIGFFSSLGRELSDPAGVEIATPLIAGNRTETRFFYPDLAYPTSRLTGSRRHFRWGAQRIRLAGHSGRD